jgi:class 3 adenylate cyclase
LSRLVGGSGSISPDLASGTVAMTVLAIRADRSRDMAGAWRPGVHDTDVSDGSVRSARDGDAYPERGESIDELLDRAVAAINRGGRVTATVIAGHVLAVDEKNADAEDLLASPGDGGEIRRLTIMFAALVDSTALSTRVAPETYRLPVGRYRDLVLGIVNRYEGHVGFPHRAQTAIGLLSSESDNR